MKYLSFIKYITVVLAGAVLAGCGKAASRKEDVPQETDISVNAYAESYKNIVSPDFRQIIWGMTESEIYGQEGRAADHVIDYDDMTILEYDDVKEFGYSCRLDYRIGYGSMCISAEYVISAEEQQSRYGDSIENVSRYLDELYAEETENPYGSGEIYRKTRSAEIFLSTDTGGRIHILFKMPEGYFDERYEHYTVMFDENGNIINNK